MALIQGIDGNALLTAFRQGREDRRNDSLAEIKIGADRREAVKQRQIGGILGQMMGGQSTGGISGAYDPPKPATTPGIGDGASDQAFSGEAMGQIAQGVNPPVTAPAAPQPAPQAPPPPAHNPNLLQQLMYLDPETGSKIASGLKTMNETQLAQRQAQNDASGTAAHYIMQGKTPQERQARLQHVVPLLQENGIPPEGIQRLSGDLSDTALQAYTGMAIDFDKMIDNERAERELQMGKVITPQAGAGAFLQRPDGAPLETLVAPNDGTHTTGAPVHGDASVPGAAADYLKQHPELRGQFDQKYGAGTADRILGGGASNGTGGFPR